MTVLAIDTASRHRLVVLRAGLAGELVAARTASGGAALPWLDRCLVELGLSDLGAVVVVTGPGSYTGLRSGIAIGLGVAHTLGLPLHGVSSLEVAARSAPDGENETLALVEAGRDGACAYHPSQWPPGSPPTSCSASPRPPLCPVAGIRASSAAWPSRSGRRGAHSASGSGG